MSDVLAVALSSWIVQEGNYTDFARGDRAAFAVEFYCPRAWRLIDPLLAPSLVNTWGPLHEAAGVVVYCDEEWWVVDAGTPIFRKERPPPHVQLGAWVRGGVSLSVDPHFYCDMLAHRPDAPPLIYDWVVEKIEIQTAPLDRSTGVRDYAKLGWREVGQTDVWTHDDGHADYVLHCRRQVSPPRRGLAG